MSKNSGQVTFNTQQAMLRALKVSCGSVTKAAAMVDITPQTHYNWYRNNEVYRDNVDNIKYEVFEGYKDMVIEAVFKKVSEGNTSVINKCFNTLFAKWAEQMERANPYRPRLLPKINYVKKPEHGDLSV
jgi:hypothetical protein